MLTRLDIKNFRSCSDVSLELAGAVTAIVGKNGVGKTNLLHAIRIAAGLCTGSMAWTSLAPQHELQPAELSISFILHDRKYIYRVSHWIANQTTSQIAEYLKEVTDGTERSLFERRDEVATTPFIATHFKLGRSTSALAALLQLFPEDSDLVKELSPIQSFLKSVQYYRLNDEIEEHNWISPFTPESTYQQWLSGDLPPGNPAYAIMLRMIHMKNDRAGEFEELVSLLGPNGLGVVSEIVVDRTFMPTGALAIADRSKDLRQSAYVVAFVPGDGLAGAGGLFPYSGLSAGTRRVIELITRLVYDSSSVMLLEQPEDCIHAGLVRRVLDILAVYSSKSQLVFTTHSSRVVNLLSPDQIRVVSANMGMTVVAALSKHEIQEANDYVRDQGTLAEYLETL